MREIRPSGSEGGETDSSVFPTPIIQSILRLRNGKHGLVAHATEYIIPHTREDVLKTNSMRIE